MLKFSIKDRQGVIKDLELMKTPDLNLMEILKSNGYKMRATCGGMGLCADCLCRISKENNNFPAPTDQELDTLDNIPEIFDNSRLCCQIAPGEHLNSILLELSCEDH